jgi:hypothetical protein
MGGLAVFAWIGIGAAIGWAISRLMRSGPEDDPRRGKRRPPPPAVRFRRSDVATHARPGRPALWNRVRTLAARLRAG